MIKKITEKEYRAIPLNSSSSLKDFSVDRRKYHKKYILKEDKKSEEDDDSQAVIMGRLVETLLMEPEEFDNQFFMSSVVNIPGGFMGDFAIALAKHTVNATNEDGVITEDFMSLAEKAYVDSKFKLKLETVIGKFVGSDAEVYYNERRLVMFNNLTVLTANDVNNAERIVRELKENAITSTIVNLVTPASVVKRYEVKNQMKVVGFKIGGMELKAMLDKVIIDHVTKTVQIYDLKCTWNVENFYKEYYLYRRAYIQAYVYYRAIEALTKDISSPCYKYTVLGPKFIVCDSINYYSPLIYDVSDKNLKDAFEGFEVRGYKYPGVRDIIKELQWAMDNDIWNISKSNYNNYGRVKLEY